MLARSQAQSMSRESMQPGTHPKKLEPVGREAGMPLPTNVAGKGHRAEAAKKLQKRENYP